MAALSLGFLMTILTVAGHDSADAPLVTPIPSSHPLLYDASLGIYGQSDHVGSHYPFSNVALAQSVPPPLVAAGIVEPESLVNGIGTAPEIVVHGNAASSDVNAVAAFNGDGRLWVAYTSFRGEGENIYVRYRDANGNWSREEQITERALADFDPVLGRDKNSHLWLIWCRQKSDSEWPLMGRLWKGDRWGDETVLVPGKNYFPTVQYLSEDGSLVLAWENWDSGSSRIYTSWWNGEEWSALDPIPFDVLPQQRPALATKPGGDLSLVFDIVENQRYDIRLIRWIDGKWASIQAPPIIEGHRRRASVAVDAENRVWILPETEVIEPIEVRRSFNGQDVIYNVRPPSRAMLVWDRNAWKGLPPGPAMSSKAATVHVDRQGTVWILSRTPGPGTRDFLLVGQRYRGNQWYTDGFAQGPWGGDLKAETGFTVGSRPIGSLKEQVAVIEADESLVCLWHDTKRRFVNQPAWTYADGPVSTIMSRLPLEATNYQPAQLSNYDPMFHGTASKIVKPLPHASMPDANYKTEIDGEPLRVYFGDLHHHTEFSRDPGVMNDDVDGNHRYARDIRHLDFVGLSDHAEHVNPHDWYLTRRAASFYNNGDRFAAMLAFEWTSEFYRNGNYQEGHHNIVYRTDGPETKIYSASLPRSNTPLRLIERIEEDIRDAKVHNIDANTLLFPHDPNRWVQPISWSWYNPRIRLLELVQSRGAHEHLGGPQRPPLRNDFQQELMGKSAQDGLKRGLRWGFIGSGDHQGRPVAGVFSPAGDRKRLFDSLYAKRTFATTGARIVASCSVNGHRMGSEWRGTETKHEVEIFARGTAPITFVELWKNGRILWRWSPTNESHEFKANFKDPSAPYFRENWWYVRVTQADGEIAWTSPVWYVYDGIPPIVVADAGGPEPHYVMPNFKIPLPVLMRNQKDNAVSGKMVLNNVPDNWKLEPEGPIDFELPAHSWTTYVWYVVAPEGSIERLHARQLELNVEYENEKPSSHSMTIVECPKLLNTRGQLSELNDAVYLQKDMKLLNQWLDTMAVEWRL